MLISSEPEPETEFSSILKQAVVPGGTSAVMVLGVGSCREIPSINGAATRCVSDYRPVSVHLREQFNVCGFTASRTGAGVLKQRLKQL